MPVIDISRLTSPSTSREEVEKLHSALISCGCFMVCFSNTLLESNYFLVTMLIY
jgi:hypothetical protein